VAITDELIGVSQLLGGHVPGQVHSKSKSMDLLQTLLRWSSMD